MTESKLPNVLIIDDEPNLNQALHDAFEDYDFEVYSALSGELGLFQLEENKIDVCIVDMRLPGMTGNEFIIAAHSTHPHLKFIIHTGSTDYSIPQKLRRIGVEKEHIFIKPVKSLSELINAVIKIYNPMNGSE